MTTKSLSSCRPLCSPGPGAQNAAPHSPGDGDPSKKASFLDPHMAGVFFCGFTTFGNLRNLEAFNFCKPEDVFQAKATKKQIGTKWDPQILSWYMYTCTYPAKSWWFTNLKTGIRFQGWFQWVPILSIIYVMRSQWSHQINLICLEHIIAYIEYGHIYIHISFRYINVYMYVSLKWLKLLVSSEWELIGCTCGRLRWSQPLLPDSLPRNARWPSPCILVVDTSCELMTA